MLFLVKWQDGTFLLGDYASRRDLWADLDSAIAYPMEAKFKVVEGVALDFNQPGPHPDAPKESYIGPGYDSLAGKHSVNDLAMSNEGWQTFDESDKGPTGTSSGRIKMRRGETRIMRHPVDFDLE